MSLRIAIIGAGMAGVSAGRWLAAQGHEVTLLEKMVHYRNPLES